MTQLVSMTNPCRTEESNMSTFRRNFFWRFHSETCFRASRSRLIGALQVIEESHETKIHVQLLVAVEERQTRIVSHEFDFRFLVAAEHDHVLENSGGWFPCQTFQFETMAMQMHGMNVVARVTHVQAVAFPLFQMKARGNDSLRHRMGDTIDSPAIEALFRGVVLCKGHLKRLVRRCCIGVRFSETGIVP